MSKTIVVTDTDSSMPGDMAEKYHIKLVPITIQFSEESYSDFFEIKNELLFKKMDESKTTSYAFETEVYNGLKALCINTNFMSSDTLASKFDSSKHDLMIGFAYNGRNWGISLRSVKGGVNVSEIAKARGGGGHENASGFQVDTFEDIFK